MSRRPLASGPGGPVAQTHRDPSRDQPTGQRNRGARVQGGDAGGPHPERQPEQAKVRRWSHTVTRPLRSLYLASPMPLTF